MIVSWNWLNEYFDKMPAEAAEIAARLTMSGLNHEESVTVGQDLAIDLEVTSNRPDCLGHLGVAREIAALFGVPLKIPDPLPENGTPPAAAPASSLVQIRIEASDLCSLYTGRVIRSVRVGNSPQWMQDRLKTAGINPVNNIVDCTNYVMLECGQPLHAFDLARLGGPEIIVRQPGASEKITAIDHRQYDLHPGMCVIADSGRAVAIAGVMGGADSEVTVDTQDVLIEAAVFAQQAVRSAARKLNLHSPSSFRFERGVNPYGVDWASRRCCELILQTAGGQLADGAVVAGGLPDPAPAIVLRQQKIANVLGIEIPAENVLGILQRLGIRCEPQSAGILLATPPAWRADLTREIDLVEEVGRITGYNTVPDDVVVPMVATTRTPRSRVAGLVRTVLTGAGFDEAMTPSLVPGVWSEIFSPWTSSPPLQSSQPMLGVLEKASQNIGAVDLARRSLVPSLLEARRINEFRGNIDADLFEMAHAYLPQSAGLPDEPWLVALAGGRTFAEISGIVEKIVRSVCPGVSLTMHDCDLELLHPTFSCEFRIDGQSLGWGGELDESALKNASLKKSAAVAELNVNLLLEHASLIRRQSPVSNFPSVSRDFNFVMGNEIRWEQIEQTVRRAGGELLESVAYRETFRDEKRDGAGRKRILLTVVLRSFAGTLTGEVAEETCAAIVSSCEKELAARLA